MVSDQAVLHSDAPHEGCRIATHPPAIVGLMRNSLSEALRRKFNRVPAPLFIEMPEEEAEVAEESGEGAVVAAHDAVALLEAGAMILVGHAVTEIVDGDRVKVDVAVGISGLETAEGPFEIGTETILQVIFGREVATHHECLMTHKHSVCK